MKNRTFPKFIERVLYEWNRSHTANEHWRPYYLHCDYCDIKYDFIGRVENFESDFEYVAQQANISLHHVPSKSLHVHPSGGNKRFSKPKKISQKDKDEKVTNYFSQLDSRTLKRLYEMYKIDFVMFGYHLYPYVMPSQMT